MAAIDKMGYKEDLALSKVFNRVPTYDELAGEDYYDPKKIAPGIKREYTRFVMSPFFIRAHDENVQKATFLDEVNSLQFGGGGGMQPLPSSGGGGGGQAQGPDTSGSGSAPGSFYGSGVLGPQPHFAPQPFVSAAQNTEMADIAVQAELEGHHLLGTGANQQQLVLPEAIQNLHDQNHSTPFFNKPCT